VPFPVLQGPGKVLKNRGEWFFVKDSTAFPGSIPDIEMINRYEQLCRN